MLVPGTVKGGITVGSATYRDVDPPYLDPNYEVTVLRAPLKPNVVLPQDWFHDVKGPAFDTMKVTDRDSDLTRQCAGEPLGSRVKIFGNVSDSDGRPVSGALIEIWQSNAAGRYVDAKDLWGFPIDPNFIGAGKCLTDDKGNYEFISVRPGAYPTFYTTGEKGWRAAHVHFSLFGYGFESRLITQMYFEGDPLLSQDRMLLGIPDRKGQDRLIAKVDYDESQIDLERTLGASNPFDNQGRLVAPGGSLDIDATSTWNTTYLAYRFDIVLRGARSTYFEPPEVSA
jgi:protocatechuate 3,4-dioxygenase beta subunit